MSANAAGRVGPNAVTQVAAALRAEGGLPLARQVFGAAGLLALLSDPPGQMVPQSTAKDLHDTVSDLLEPDAARRVSEGAGWRTADYLLAHRIPRAAQWAMGVLPVPLSARLLLTAMARNAWTYAGTGDVHTSAGPVCRLDIDANPLAQPGCPWHVAVFERLFTELVSPRVKVRHTACCARGAAFCAFEIDLRDSGRSR